MTKNVQNRQLQKIMTKDEFLRIPKELIRIYGLEISGLIAYMYDWKYYLINKKKVCSDGWFYIEQNRIVYPPNAILIDELRSFGYTKTAGGRFQYGAPEGQHDDMVNSLALAVWELSEQPLGEGAGEIFLPPVTDY